MKIQLKVTKDSPVQAYRHYAILREGEQVGTLSRGTDRRWEVDDKGANTFIGFLTGYESEPVCVDTVILRHPIMEVDTFQAAYAEAAPELGVWLD